MNNVESSSSLGEPETPKRALARDFEMIVSGESTEAFIARMTRQRGALEKLKDATNF